MKKKILFIMLSVLIIAGLTACSVESESTDGTAESTVFSTTKTESAAEKEITESETTTQKSESSEIATTTTTRPADQKSSGQTPAKNQSSTTAKRDKQHTTVSKKSETTKAVVTTTKQSTTKKVTTTQKQTTTQKAFDIDYWMSYAKSYAKSVGLNLSSDASDCWDNPINANPNCKNLERDIQSRLNRYAKDDYITDVWIWAESTGNNSYLIYIGYA